jgi:hypothetical protein
MSEDAGIHTILLSTNDEVITYVRRFDNAYVVVEYPHRVVTSYENGMLEFELVPLMFSGNMGEPFRIYRKHIVAQTLPDINIANLYKKQMEILGEQIEKSALYMNSFKGDDK